MKNTPADNTKSGSVNFIYSIENPTTFITSSANWCNEPDSYDLSSLWNDFQCDNPAVDIDGNEIRIVESSGRRKSIFDPSPLGWRLPIQAVWNGFNGNTFTTNIYASDLHQSDRYYNLTNTLYVANNTEVEKMGSMVIICYLWSASPTLT